MLAVSNEEGVVSLFNTQCRLPSYFSCQLDTRHVEKERSMKLSPCSGSSLECQPSVSPLVDMSLLSDKAGEPAEEQ